MSSSQQYQFNISTIDVSTMNPNTNFTNIEALSPVMQINGIDESSQTPHYQQAQIGRSKTAPNSRTGRKGPCIRHTSSTSNIRATSPSSRQSRYGGSFPYTSPQGSPRETPRSPSPTTSVYLDSPEPVEERTCYDCQKEFSRARDLKRHYQKSNAHNAQARYQCYLCKQEFKRSDVIKRHTYNKKCLDTFIKFDDDQYEAC